MTKTNQKLDVVKNHLRFIAITCITVPKPEPKEIVFSLCLFTALHMLEPLSNIDKPQKHVHADYRITEYHTTVVKIIADFKGCMRKMRRERTWAVLSRHKKDKCS